MYFLVENKLKKLQTFDSIYFTVKSHFEEDGTQNQLVFQPMQRYFKQVSGVGSGNYIYLWKSKGFYDANITAPNTSDQKLNPELSYYGTKTRVEFSRNCLREDKITQDHGKIVNIYTVYEISKSYNISTYPTLKNCLFDVLTLTKSSDDISYSGQVIGFDRHGIFLHHSSATGKTITIFGVDMSSSTKINKQKSYFNSW